MSWLHHDSEYITDCPSTVDFPFVGNPSANRDDSDTESELEDVDLEQLEKESQWNPQIQCGDEIPASWGVVRFQGNAEQTTSPEFAQDSVALRAEHPQIDTTPGTWTPINKPQLDPMRDRILRAFFDNNFKNRKREKATTKKPITIRYDLRKLRQNRELYEKEHSDEFVSEELDWFQLRAACLDPTCDSFKWEIASFRADWDKFQERQDWLALELQNIDNLLTKIRHSRQQARRCLGKKF